jgi:hypothetical protein
MHRADLGGQLHACIDGRPGLEPFIKLTDQSARHTPSREEDEKAHYVRLGFHCSDRWVQ